MPSHVNVNGDVRRVCGSIGCRHDVRRSSHSIHTCEKYRRKHSICMREHVLFVVIVAYMYCTCSNGLVCASERLRLWYHMTLLLAFALAVVHCLRVSYSIRKTPHVHPFDSNSNHPCQCDRPIVSLSKAFSFVWLLAQVLKCATRVPRLFFFMESSLIEIRHRQILTDTSPHTHTATSHISSGRANTFLHPFVTNQCAHAIDSSQRRRNIRFERTKYKAERTTGGYEKDVHSNCRRNDVH